MADKILINGLRIFGHHGVGEEERRRGQYFVVDITAELDLREAAASDVLDATVDYESLIKEVEQIVSTEQYALLEALAEKIAEAVLERPRVRGTRVRVAKPEPPIDAEIGSVQVEITRP